MHAPFDLTPFSLYHGLGNDYLIVERDGLSRPLPPNAIGRICDRHFGIGADGILISESSRETSDAFQLTILNPDGSEAEKSGNGLRIFSRYLFDHRRVSEQMPFTIVTGGGTVTSTILDGGRQVRVAMGRATFDATAIPVRNDVGDVLERSVVVGGRTLTYSAVSVGNPHCVLIGASWSEADARALGADLEIHPNFPNRTNVQFVNVLNRNRIRLFIWERGAGYTLASGSSSCAAAAVCRRLDLCDERITAEMPGGELSLIVSESFDIDMEGPVVAIAQGHLATELLHSR
ncbi:MAG: diaminopimelate epimerase [Pseudomonadota bacterium]